MDYRPQDRDRFGTCVRAQLTSGHLCDTALIGFVQNCAMIHLQRTQELTEDTPKSFAKLSSIWGH